jgi:hypothetical protein
MDEKLYNECKIGKKKFRHTMDEKNPLAPRNHDFLGELGAH